MRDSTCRVDPFVAFNHGCYRAAVVASAAREEAIADGTPTRQRVDAPTTFRRGAVCVSLGRQDGSDDKKVAARSLNVGQ